MLAPATMRPCNNAAVFAATLAGAALTLGAQETLIPPPAQAVPRTVLLSVLVTDDRNQPFAGLRRENFTVYENDRPQQIATFTKSDAPFSIGIIIDLSGSMALKLEAARQSILGF